MRDHDGRFIRASMERHRFTAPTRAFKSKHFGRQHPSPLVTVAIPLFGRYDFIDHQLLEFALDDWFVENCEIVYFVDDPSIIDDVLYRAELLVEEFGISFVVCWTGMNHGFAAATNLASRAGRGEYVLMLNSDVIPIKAGWLHSMLKGLKSDASLGIVGAQLLSASGGVQHNGMICLWEPGWGAYLNKHPNSGLAPSAVSEDDIADRVLVTAACLLVSRRTFEEVGGLNEKYLIGDFEDSDFCFKVRSLGLKVACLQTRSLIHLERQSFSRIGDSYLREYIARLNATIHTESWKKDIENLLGDVQ